MSRRRTEIKHIASWRLNLVRLVFLGLLLVLGWRLVDIQVLNADFLRSQGDARHIRDVPVVAHRGMILDRHGEPLAVSTPVHSVWLNPQQTASDNAQLKTLAKLLNIRHSVITKKITGNKTKEFVYLKRRIPPELAAEVKQLDIAGVALQREYKRYYPVGEVASHLLGFTNIDDNGQEGLELAYDNVLSGAPGVQRMMRDSRGTFVSGGEQIKPTKAGENISLSIDLRLQHLSYQSLKSTVNKYNARSGSAVILDVRTGEILAMVNQPAFNPNNRRGLKVSNFRNRAVTDLFEPGSLVKPFTVTNGLKSGEFTKSTIIDTRPGLLTVSGHTIKDFRNYGEINIETLIQKSSNVGASKIALALKPDQLWQGFSAFGLGEPTGAYFPGEAVGTLPDPRSWRELDRAVLAYGYGLATSTLQIARAYMVLANGGILQPVSFIKMDEAPTGRRVFSREIMQQVLSMMETVVQQGGTAIKAAVENYSVAGKTGTVRKAIRGGYAEDHYLSLFAGVIPASNPRLVMVVVVDDPQGDKYYGGLIAAPVFSEVMAGAMRLLNVAPDNLPTTRLQLVQK